MVDTKRCRLGRGESSMAQAEDSILQVCQLRELKQTKEWERYPNRFRYLYGTILQENLEKHCQEWPAGKPESEIKLLTEENSKPQDLIVYTDGTVTKHRSGWGFTVKQVATTIHEDSAAYTVSTSSLTMEVKQSLMPSAGLPQQVTAGPHRPSSSQYNELATKSEK